MCAITKKGHVRVDSRAKTWYHISSVRHHSLYLFRKLSGIVCRESQIQHIAELARPEGCSIMARL